jgi:hypothetical protein
VAYIPLLPATPVSGGDVCFVLTLTAIREVPDGTTVKYVLCALKVMHRMPTERRIKKSR